MPGSGRTARPPCFHCGEPCPDPRLVKEDKPFCCQGCLVVHDLLNASGLGHFYELNQRPGIRIGQQARREQWAHLDDPVLQQRLLDFTDGRLSRITLAVPQIHCVACVWLLENLFRLHAGVGRSRVNFAKREVAVTFAPERIRLSELVALLASIGYEPRLTLDELEPRPRRSPGRQRQYLQVGVAGFAFGNIMLFSIPQYFGLDSFSGPTLRVLFGYLSLVLALPVLVFSAADYWRSAALALRQRLLTLDVPIAAGLAALYLQSTYEIVTGRGEGYLDSLAALVFFLLCGRFFQQVTHDRLAFDRDYKCFFPLSVVRLADGAEAHVALSEVRVGDRLRVRNGELVPADARLIAGPACIDYSFVTGESEPVGKEPGAYLYAGGKQQGGALEIEIVKPVSQSYLTSLWDHEAFRKERDQPLQTMTNRYSRRFTLIVVAIAVGAAIFWSVSGAWSRGLRAFTAVLIVACPCALALAAPFALGTAQRALARRQVFLRNGFVIERLADIDTIVFDKTGTLTAAASQVEFQGPDGAPPNPPLQPDEISALGALAAQSTHPLAMRVAEWCGGSSDAAAARDFQETPGGGIEAVVRGQRLALGSRAWLATRGVAGVAGETVRGDATASETWLAVDGRLRGAFRLAPALRPETRERLGRLGERFEVALLSGDHDGTAPQFRALLGDQTQLHFNQSPLQKLEYIRTRQQSGRRVMMVGDGLNDAGALSQSDVGVAVVERVGSFSPASDIIVAGALVPHIEALVRLARRTVRVVRWSFGISAAYNLVGVSIAASGFLSPAVCAVLMPLSSISVVAFACGATQWAARYEQLD